MLADDVKAKIFKAISSGTLQVRSVDTSTGEVVWGVVEDILQHASAQKAMLEVYSGEACTVVTEDHSLFKLDAQGLPVEVLSKDIHEGDTLASVVDGVLTPSEVTKVNISPCCEYTYDLAVPGYHNFVLANGVLAHNSYSISGVSLDIDKSSKYQAMKENFESEHEKMLDQAKTSIKIVKGLQQPRYGIGISSALGPFSRVGVQSRRNYVSGGMGGWS